MNISCPFFWEMVWGGGFSPFKGEKRKRRFTYNDSIKSVNRQKLCFPQIFIFFKIYYLRARGWVVREHGEGHGERNLTKLVTECGALHRAPSHNADIMT